ncbi:MAG: ion channel [Actinomycetia bacterium]|nr:ion channel [Actinomycetes bacterium]
MTRVSQVLSNPVGHGLGSLLCALLVLYGFPERLSFERFGIGVLAFCIGTIGLALLAIAQIGRMVRPFPGAAQYVRLVGVLSLVYIATCFFALAYYLIASNEPGQFVGLRTRTDALYYAVVTLATVGYGDVHAVGQAARIATTVHVAFNLVVIGALLAVTSSLLADRLRDRR